MFKIPDWEGDVPKTDVDFVKRNKAHKIKSKEIKEQAVDTKKDSPKTWNQNGKTKSNYVMLKNNDKINQNLQKNNKQIVKKNKKNYKKQKQSMKSKLSDNNISNTKKKKISIQQEIEQNYDTDKPDEILLSAEKKKLNKQIQSDGSEELLFGSQKQNEKSNNNHKKISNGVTKSIKNQQNKAKNYKKKLLIQSILQKENNRRHIDISNNGNKLRERMLERLKDSDTSSSPCIDSLLVRKHYRWKDNLRDLKSFPGAAAQFRYLNEKLYTTSGTEAQKLFQSDPVAFQTYHEGYQQQMKKWPIKPLDIIVKKITKMSKSHLVADMGCGEAELSKRVAQKVRSFDLVAAAENVETCDMAHTPLLSASMDVVVYCLALMGTNLTQYLVEANRVLKVGGFLLIAEVESRFDKVESFAQEVQRLGFKLKELDKSNQVFFFMEFIKTQEPPVKKSKLPELTLKPCLYKKR